ncbi:MAG: MATE family efflux transporter [Eubacteriales bacterium]|nr:MATE family efflux transporter [Eubacteriales bacterium]
MKKMTEGNIIKHLISYALPLIFGNIFQLTYNAVDSIVIGKFAGEDAVAAVAASNPVMTIIILGVSGMCIGASVLMSEFYGSGDTENLKKEVATTLIAGIVFSLAVFGIGMPLAKPILGWMNVPEDILGMATVYLRIIFVGFLFTFLYNAMSSALRSTGDSKTPVKFLILSSILNAGLDVLFICGGKMGVVGAGLATVIAEGFSAILCFVYVYRHIPLLQIKRSEFRVDPELLKKTLRHGSVTALQQSCQPIGKVLIQSCMNAQGISVIAAFNAVNRIDDFACIPEQSISHGMMTCVAQNRGAGKQSRIKETLRKGLMLEVLYWACICAATLLLKTPVMKLFAPEESVEMIQAGVDYLTLMAFFYILPGLTNGMQGYFRGMGKMKVTLAATIIQVSLRVVFVYILVPRIGMTGAAYACMIGWTLMLLYEIPYYFYCEKREKRKGAEHEFSIQK